MRSLAPLSLMALALAACTTDVPNSAAEAELRASGASTLPQAVPVSSAPLGEGEALAAETTAALGLPPATTGVPLSAMGPATTAAPTGDPVRPASISDEQDFAAVSGRETIESDAARIAANRSQYQVIQPEALPQRPDGSGASIVAYALATNNVPGQPLYRRSSLFQSQARFERACAKYGAADRAQEAFLDAGGPDRDRKGLDPDGDGFACFWDPRPFRTARDGAPEVVTEYEVIETPGES